MNDKKIIVKIKELRDLHKISQSELADKLGISRQSIIALEQGRFFPSLPLTVEICNFFDKAFEEVFEFDRPKAIFCQPDQNQLNIKPLITRKEAEMPSFLEPMRPFRDSLSLREAMDRLMEDSFVSPRTIASGVMKINVLDKGKSIVVKAEVPGIEEEKIDIEVADEMLTISGEREEEKEVKEEDYYHKETHFGSFSRTIALPSPVVSEKAEASVEKGILIITIPKIEEKKANKVKVKTTKK